jgi:hypothetical protein
MELSKKNLMDESLGNEEFEYPMLAHLFLDLRGKGMSLSSVDLDILNAWENSGLKAEFIAKVMLEYFDECKQKSKVFPASLLPISRKVRSILIKTSEF